MNIRRLALLGARLLAGAALLALAAWLVGLRTLLEQLSRIDPVWFALAVLSMAASQWVSAARWTLIAAILGLKAPPHELRVAYAQAMAVNVVLPGATLGGDTLRSVRLQGLGNPLGESALSVLLDRASGLWILCILSLATGLGLLLGGQLDRVQLPAPMATMDIRSLCWVYLLGLCVAAALPFVPLRVPGAPARGASRSEVGSIGSSRGARMLARLAELHALTVSRSRALARSLWSSVLVQVLCALALWLCQLAAGGRAGYLAVQAIAAPVFIAGVVPLSYGGFGARELVALLVFPLVGVDAQTAVAASALYGLGAVLLGLATSPLLVLRASR
ncbi:MAG TPA: lysylphosphatidylglycerol synthase transmembrane domain-containing protein [Burkholderiaceae bacterium]|nr:lysylphosphatidylglycerol synthase transmembrane domain-containing protein [Burkholderiaceae bacterium]